MEIKDIVGKRVAIWCDTEEKANDYLSKVRSLIKTVQDQSFYFENESETCYIVNRGGYTFSDKEWLINNEYLVISYNDFFGISEQVKDDAESEMSTVEIVEWLCNNYFNEKYGEVFGYDYDLDCLLYNLSAEEVIKRINAYEREQRKIKVSDDEISTLLDEKYGVGKWVRNVKKL